jgi:hypothetical protein
LPPTAVSLQVQRRGCVDFAATLAHRLKVKGTSRPAKRAPAETVLRIDIPEWRIVDDVTWYAVHAQMVGRSSWRDDDPRKRPAPWPKYPLSGIARCSCGYAIGVVRKYRPTRGWESAYGCSANRWRGKSVCSISFAQTKDEVEERMVAYLIGIVIRLLLAGLYLRLPQAQGMTNEEKVVDALKDISRNIERQTKAIEDAGRECRR